MKQIAIALLLSVSVAAMAPSAEAQLQKGDYLAVIGDSITEEKKYTMFIEEYLVMCQPAQELGQMQFGWSGDTSYGFQHRMQNDMLRFKPTVATTCFGMNDGHYGPMTPETEKEYRAAQTNIVQQMKKAGVRLIVVGSPGCVDVRTFRGNREKADMYNKTLASLGDIAKEVAEKEGVVFADVHSPMYDVMIKAEAKYGNDYNIAGHDGVHPDNNGQLVMAYAFLKSLGCKGDIGTITVNLADNKAEATDGHKILSSSNGTVEVESSRYPFCFEGEDPSKTDSTRGVLEFCPFNQDLNRLMLIVNGAGSAKVKVTWGSASKEFEAAELQKGINLAAEFLDNPFSQPFHRIETQIHQKEDWETPLVKEFIHQIPQVAKEAQDALNEAAAKAIEADKDLCRAITLSVVPVKHAIKIEVVKK